MIKISYIYNIHLLCDQWCYLYERGRKIWRYSPLQSYECALLQMKSYYWNPKRLLYKPVFIVAESDLGGAIFPFAINKLRKDIRDFFLFSPIDYTDIITDIKDKEFLRKLFNECIKNWCNYTVTFSHYRQDSALYSIIGGRCNERKETCVNIIINNMKYDEYFSSLSKHQRQNVRTAYNKIRKEEIEWHFSQYNKDNTMSVPDKNECQLMYEDRCNKKNNISGIFNDLKSKIRRKSNFVNRAIFELTTSSTFVLYINETPAAYAGGYYDESHKKFYVPRLSINNKFRNYSPGIILVNEIVKVLIESGVEVLDLTRGTETYKYAMGGIEHYTYCLSSNISQIYIQ